METSCGVVLVNLDSILLLQYPQGHWDLPKGHLEVKDLNKRVAAQRELNEETGINEIEFIDGFEMRTEYNFRHKNKIVNKEVWWFLAETQQLSVVLSHEHLNYIWLEWNQAKEMLTHQELVNSQSNLLLEHQLFSL